MATLQDLYPALSAVAEALRSQPAQIKAAEAQLDQVLKVPGAYNAAHELAAQKTIPEEVRQLAISRVKNMVSQSWRSKTIFNDEYRGQIRARVLMFLDEPNNAISYHNETIAGKIARQDFPRNWPNIIDDLMGAIQGSAQKRLSNDNDPTTTLIARRSLQVLGAILDEYSSKVLATTTPVMIELTGKLLNPLSALYEQFSSRYFSRLNAATINDPDVGYDVEIAQLIFRSITRLMIYVWNRVKQLSPEEEQIASPTNILINLTGTDPEFALELVLALHSSQQFASLNAHGQHTLKLLKDLIQFVIDDYFRAMQKQAVSRFIAMPNCTELVRYCWDQVVKAMNNPAELRTNEPTSVYPSHFLCSAMILFRESLSMWSPNRQNASEADILPAAFVEGAVRQLVQTFLPLSDASLELWSEDPEGFIEEEEKGGDAWEIDPRPCAERVLITFAAKYTEVVIPVLKSMFDAVVTTATTDLATAKQKEAYYAAIGRCAHRLKDVIDFDQWLTQVVVKEVSSTDPLNRVVKRRIAWVIAKWYSDRQLPASGGTVWEILRYLVQDQGDASDLVVRLTAAIAIGECVDTLGFDADVFQPHLPFVIEGLVQLASSCETYESKARVMNALGRVIDCVGQRVVPLVGPIQQVMASLWEASSITDGSATVGSDGAVWLFRASMLVLAKSLVTVSGEQSNSLVPIVIPLIRQSLTPESKLYLDADALQLWLAALRNATALPAPQPGVLCLSELIPELIREMHDNIDLLGTLLQILESYLLLNATMVVQLHGSSLFDVLKKIHSSFNVKDVLAASELIFRLADPTSWPEPLHNSEYFWDLLKHVIEDKLNANLLSEHICLFSRIALQDPNVFNQLITAGATAHGAQDSPLFEGLLDQWWNKFDVIAESRLRKLTGMGIAALVSTGRHEVMDRLSTEILNMWMDIHGELKESQVAMDEWVKGGSNPDEEPLHLHWERDGNTPPDTFMRGSEDTLEEARRKQVWENDPIRKVKFTTFVAEKMQQGTIACGGQEVLQTKYLKHAEPALLQQLEVALASGL
ncbi:Importin beta-like protein kap113 [Rhizoctonia solani]|uniref:Importin beta-like protein kap113 n=1 Tax=Rhizoctonia solani TaxID=456999 RepID=A0A0K6FVZ4_9AGAM|nr:Importin beta-like protein kap113 [Rhizoctonia solani]